MYVAAEYLAPKPGEGGILNLGAPIDSYQDDWHLISHSLTLRADQSALLSMVFERNAE